MKSFPAFASLTLRWPAAWMFVLMLAACHAGQAEQREPSTVEVAKPTAATTPQTSTPSAAGVAVAGSASAPAGAVVPELPENAPARQPLIADAGKGRSCKTDADCAVKDVGSCCGYRPQCLNKDTPTFPDQVKEKCAREGRVSTCGMLAVSGCQCVSGQCENLLLSDESLPAAPAPLQ